MTFTSRKAKTPSSEILGHETETSPSEILLGTAAIAEYLFGDPNMQQPIQYRLDRNELPHFYLNGSVCSTRASIRRMVSRLLEGGLRSEESALAAQRYKPQNGETDHDGVPNV